MMLSWIFIFMLLILTASVWDANAEPISLIAGTVVAFGTGAFFAFRDTIRCRMYECCHAPDIEFNAYQLSYDFDKLVYGQHLVKDVVVNALKSHWANENPKKPLVLSFHGYTGSGKNYVAEIIANNTYRHGLRSSFVHHFVATADFPDRTRMEQYQIELRDRVLQSVKKCQRSLFIFDETDKLPEKLLASIKPYLDYYSAVSGVDFRRSVFIFLSNRGGSAIAELTVSQYEAGVPRESLGLDSFERVVMDFAYNEGGGLKMSELISNHLIDHFIPFLPLQREHVRKCVETHLRNCGRSDLIADTALVDRVLNALQYFPEDSKAFSSSGCKRVSAKADLEMGKSRRITYNTGIDDEL